MSALPLIRAAAAATKFVNTNVVHPVLFPYPLGPVLHASRISFIFRSQVNRTRSKISWLHDIAGFLVMCWAGQIAVSAILGLPYQPLLSTTPWIIYGGTHLFLTLLFSFLPPPSAAFLDMSLPLVDAISRTGPICAAIEAVHNHTNPAWSSSLFAQIALGTIACATSGIVASSVQPWEENWTIRIPAFIKSPSILSTFDIWTGAITSVIYASLALTHPDWATILSLPDKPFMTPLAARATAVVVLTTLYTIRAFYTHYYAPTFTSPPSAPAPVQQKEQVAPVPAKANGGNKKKK